MTAELEQQLHDLIADARWFGGKGRPFQVIATRRLELTDRVWVELVTVRYADSGEEVYQLPLAAYPRARDELAHAQVAAYHDPELGPVQLYDALHDPDAVRHWLREFATTHKPTPGRGLVFHTWGTPDLELPADAGSVVLSGEQSNSSVVVGDRVLLKVFRRVVAGINPDVELLAALTEAGVADVAALHGWVELPGASRGEPGSQPMQLAILQEFLRDAEDGWQLARESIGSQETAFVDEARQLGQAVARVHTALAEAFPVEQWDTGRLAEVAEAMAARLERAQRVVPELEPHAPALHALFEAVRRARAPVPAQRVHGDLHLGQTLRTADGWRIIDFEGEPAAPLSGRRAPDVVWRDVAGMLRSFDYAGESAPERAVARPWVAASGEAFLSGYREALSDTVGGSDPDQTLLRAYAADKAVYEAVYEARLRPSWLPIPLAALARLAEPPG